MTLRERIADWIAAVLHAASWRRMAKEYGQLSDIMIRNFDEVLAERDRAEAALRRIAAMETPSANATVRRMAAAAREALK